MRPACNRGRASWKLALPQQIGAICAGALERLFSAPLCDLRVISREQDFRNFPASEFGRPRVLRRFQRRAFAAETIVDSGSLMSQCTRQQAHDCVNENDCSDSAVCEHIIANRNLKIDKMFDHAVIDSFVMAAENDEMRFL